MNVGVAIIIGAALIAAAFAVSHRYEIRAISAGGSGVSGGAAYVWKIDQWTGRMMFCEYSPTGVFNSGLACLNVRTTQE